MTVTTFLIVFFGTWVAVGAATAWVMGRHGHDVFTWGLLGALFGPIVIPLAIDAHWRADALLGQPEAHAHGTPGEGPVDVLVGIDGSADASGALRTAIATLGSQIGRLSLVFVSPSDRTLATEAARDAGRVALEQAGLVAASLGAPEPELFLLTGQPSEAMRRLAESQDFDVIVVGPRGTGGTRMVLGSTADSLVRSGGVPVLVTGRPTPASPAGDADTDETDPTSTDESSGARAGGAAQTTWRASGKETVDTPS